MVYASWGDYDGNGRPDIFLSALDSGAGVLFQNTAAGFVHSQPGPVTSDITSRAGSAWGDLDNDGDLDLFVAGAGGANDLLYRNKGDGTFEPLPCVVTESAGLGMSGIWGDYDNDGLLDLFVVNGGGGPAEPNFLFRGVPQGTFTRIVNGELVTESRQSVGAAFADSDGDGDLDVFIGNLSGPNSYFRNRGDGIFTNTGSDILGDPTSGSNVPMWGDLDNDGDFDLFVATGRSVNLIYRNDGRGILTNTAIEPITSQGGDSAGGVWADFDNDGWLDLLVPHRSGRHLLYRGTGGGAFVQVTTGPIAGRTVGANGVAVADYDGDGDLDVFMSNWPSNERPALFRNDTSGNQWLRFRLVGTLSNRSGIGAKVRVTAPIRGSSITQLRQIGGHDSAGSHELVAHFGLGNAAGATSVTVEWPSGVVQELGPVVGGQTLTVIEAGTPPLRIIPNGGAFTNSILVTLRSALPGAELRYTLDGSEPTPTSLLYSDPITLTRTTTLKARLFLNGFPASELASAVFTADPGLLLIPPGGQFTNKLDVAMTSRLGGVEIRYSLDGSEPTTNSPVYLEPITLTAATTVSARAYFNGFPVTEVITGTYARVYAFDDDGVGAAWREQHFGAGYRTDPRAAADADPDNDGAHNRQEYATGSDPLDPLSGFAVGVRAVPEIAFTSIPGQVYRVLRLPAVVGAEPVPIAEITATGNRTTFVDTEAGVVVDPAFYLVLPAP